jgi:hypothetical protein
MRSAPFTLLPLLALLALAGCAPRYARVPIYDQEGIQVELRSETRPREGMPRRHDHPATISAIRVAHVLARIDVRMGADEGGDRVPAFPTVSLYKVGEEVARAFVKAAPEQEVVVRAVRQEKRFGLFTSSYLTSFVAWMDGDDLVIHLSRVEWLVPKDQEKEIPEPFTNKVVQEFKVLPAEGLVPVGTQAVAVDWRSPIFREPTHVRVGPGGRLMRRTVLLESEAPAEGDAPAKDPAVLPADLPPEALRALADLQEKRARGEISETTYHQQRRDLLREAEDRREARDPREAPDGK